MVLPERHDFGIWEHDGIFFFTEGEAKRASPSSGGALGAPAALRWATPAPASDGPRLVHRNIDSIYLSIYTEIDPSKSERMVKLRELGRERSDGDPVYLWLTDPRTGDGRTWQVTYAAPPYSFRLEIPHVASIQVARRPYARSPQCYVRIASSALTQYGAASIIAEIEATLAALQGPSADAPRIEVSRIDLAADFEGLGLDGSELFAGRWVTRARWRRIDAAGAETKREREARKREERVSNTKDRGAAVIYHGLHYSGSAFGKGDLQVVAYDKKREIEDKGGDKKYMHDVWRAGGWDGESSVWRVEVRLRKDAIKSLAASAAEMTAIGADGDAPAWARMWQPGCVTVGNGLAGVMRAIGGIWRYMVCEWLTLRDVDATDGRRSRWPVSDAWRAVQAVEWGGVIGAFNADLVDVARLRMLPREKDRTREGAMEAAALQLRFDGGADVVGEILRPDAIQAHGDGIARESKAEKLRIAADRIGIAIDVQSAEARRDLLFPGLLGTLAAWDAACDVTEGLVDDPERGIRGAVLRLVDALDADQDRAEEYPKRRRRARAKGAWRGAVRLRTTLAHHPGSAPGDNRQSWRDDSSTPAWLKGAA